jgi:signal transduction histidine kinase
MIRLQTRLLLTLISVAVVALAIVALFAMQATRRQFNAYVARDEIIYLNQTAQLFDEPIQAEELAELDNLTAEIARTYGITAVVYDAQGVIVAASDPAQVGQTVTAVPLPPLGLAVRLATADEQASTIHFYAAPGDGRIPQVMLLLANSEGLPGGVFGINSTPVPGNEPILTTSMMVTHALTTPLELAAQLAPLPAPLPDVLVNTAASQDAFLSLVNRAFVAAMGVSLLVAVLLSWVTSRRILRPVQALTAATRQMSQGDLSARVPVKGKDELAELGQSFNQMAEDLAHQEQLRRNLVTDVAHELLTPLTAVRGHLEAVQDGVLEPTPELINSLHDEVMLLDELIAELQELSLAEAGQLRLDLQPVSLVEVVMGAVTAVTPQAVAHQLTIITSLPDDLPPIELDARRMGQVFRNLLGNAIKYTAPGGEITVTAWQEGDELWVCVRDTGEGIPPEHLPHIFDRFYRADRSRARATGGSGLGLAIVKGVVEAHHGRVWAESEPGVGSLFFVSLPVAVRP